MGVLKYLEVKRQIAALGSADWSTRQRAAERLGDIKDASATTHLVKVLKDDSPGVRRAAAESLGLIADARSVHALIGCLTDSSPAVRQTAVGALNRVDPAWPRSEAAQKAVNVLIASLGDEESDIQRVAALVLGKIGSVRSIAPLIDCLSQGSASLRQTAESALTEIDPDWRRSQPARKSIASLVSSLWHEDAHVRENAANTLTRIDPDWQESDEARKAIQGFVEMLGGREAGVRRRAAAALERLGWTPATPTEMAAFHFAKGSQERLAEVGRPAIDYLVELAMKGDNETRRLAAEALCQMGGDEAIEALFDCLRESQTNMQPLAVTALDKVDSNWRKREVVQSAVPGLISTLRSREEAAREKAAVALGMIGDASIVPALIEGLNEADEHYEMGCAQALGYLRDSRAVTPLADKLREVTGSDALIRSTMNALANIGTETAEEELLSVVKSGGDLCKEALDILNRTRRNEDEHVLCPTCRAYLGVRKDLSALGTRSSGDMSQRYGRAELVGTVWYRCPGCQDQVPIS